MNSTKEKIISETIIWIKENDYTKLSLRKLTNKLGMTTGAFYKYFKSKNELFNKASFTLSKEFNNELKLNSKLSAFAQLLQIAQFFCIKVDTCPHLMQFLFFNPNLQINYSHSTDDYSFLNTTKKLVHQVNEHLSSTTDEELFIQLWSFIQGYSILIKNNNTNYNASLIQATLEKILERKEQL